MFARQTETFAMQASYFRNAGDGTMYTHNIQDGRPAVRTAVGTIRENRLPFRGTRLAYLDISRYLLNTVCRFALILFGQKRLTFPPPPILPVYLRTASYRWPTVCRERYGAHWIETLRNGRIPTWRRCSRALLAIALSVWLLRIFLSGYC